MAILTLFIWSSNYHKLLHTTNQSILTTDLESAYTNYIINLSLFFSNSIWIKIQHGSRGIWSMCSRFRNTLSPNLNNHCTWNKTFISEVNIVVGYSNAKEKTQFHAVCQKLLVFSSLNLIADVIGIVTNFSEDAYHRKLFLYH